MTLGAVRAVAEKYPGLHIIHFDAHADLRDDYLGAKLSHACVLRRCHEIVGDGRIHQFCIRSGERAEFEFAAQHTEMHKFDFTGLAALTEQLCATKEPVYLTIDLDCLDPSCFPGTGTPEAGGVSFCSCWTPSAPYPKPTSWAPTSMSWPPCWTFPASPRPRPARCCGSC